MTTFVLMPLLMDEDGNVCMDCERPIRLGADYCQRPVGWLDAINDVVVEVICTRCSS